MKKSAVDILLISMNSIFKSMSLPKQPARAQATVHKIMILLSKKKRFPRNTSNISCSVYIENSLHISMTKFPESFRKITYVLLEDEKRQI